jgi:alkylated DNA repair dioxygenase AlkB
VPSTRFLCHALDEQYTFFTSDIPSELVLDNVQFESLWNHHPENYHEIKIHGCLVKTPRWQQAYGADYHYTGRVNKALPVPSILNPLFDWCREAIDKRLNGLLLNWYDANLGHYIGKHRDSIRNMAIGAPIVTISLGDQRTFRLRPWKGEGYKDFRTRDGSVFVMPYETNLAWTHEVPHSRQHRGRRISVTARAFHK